MYDVIDPVIFLGPNGTQSSMTNKDGLRLRTYSWSAIDSRAAILFVHGHGSYGFHILNHSRFDEKPARYEGSWVEKFNEAGISVFAMDAQGCGRSESMRGLRCYVEKFDDYVADVLQFAREIRLAHTPLFVMGHSLGGCISLHAILEEPTMFAGIILLAPMISLEKVSRRGLNPYIRPLSSIVSAISPGAQIVATSSREDTYNMSECDPLGYHENTRIRNAVEYIRATETLGKCMKDVRVPFVVIHSEKDRITDVDGSKRLYTEASSLDKKLYLSTVFGHDIIPEKHNELVLDVILDWISKRIYTEPWAITTIKKLHATLITNHRSTSWASADVSS